MPEGNAVSLYGEPGRTTRGGRIRADLILLAVAVVWGSSFVAQRVAAAHVGPFLYTGARFVLGALTLLPLAARRLRHLARLEWRGGALAGLLLFGAALLQQVGLRFTTAGKAGFITGLYVVLVPLFLALVWRRSPRWSAWVASLLAAAGLFLLSGVGRLALAPGDGWELAGAVLWALHVILIGRLAGRADALRLALVQYLVCGLLSGVLGLALEADTLGGLAVAWWAVLYTGVLSVGLGFTLQVTGQRRAPPAGAAVILSLEAVFAALFGWLLLGETLTPQQLLGCGLMLGGMLLAQAVSLTHSSSTPSASS
jgi:drug/metabolite transporter (DMT)-like permease